MRPAGGCCRFSNVRFTPKSGHSSSVLGCPLCAKSRHSALRYRTSLFDHLFGDPGTCLARTATTAQAKLAGLWIERSEQTRKQPDEMSDAEIAAILRANAN